jgi:hypothetical protein
MSSVLSIHKGSKVALSLCVCRLPSRYVEPEFAKSYREWREDYELKANTRLNIADGLAYLKTPGHFLPSIEDRQKIQQRLSHAESKDDREKSTKVQVSEIDELLASEGIPELSTHESKTRNGDDRKGLKDKVRGDSELSHELQSDVPLYLLVTYEKAPDVWTFPFTNRRDSESAFFTLKRLCSAQLGIKPHFPSLAPISFRRIPETTAGLPSTRMFYYKGVSGPSVSGIRPPHESGIAGHMWANRETLKTLLPLSTWTSLRDSLPLD